MYTWVMYRVKEDYLEGDIFISNMAPLVTNGTLPMPQKYIHEDNFLCIYLYISNNKDLTFYLLETKSRKKNTVNVIDEHRILHISYYSVEELKDKISKGLTKLTHNSVWCKNEN